MKKDKHQRRNLRSAAALAVIGVLGLGGCKTIQKTKTPEPDKPVIPQKDSIRPPYGEAVLMYGTPYRKYEMKDAVPEDSDHIEADNTL